MKNEKSLEDTEGLGRRRLQHSNNARYTLPNLKLDQNFLRGRIERKLNMQKGWASQSPAVLLRKYLATHQLSRHMLLQTAAIRSMRLPIVLIQMHLRRQVEADPDKNRDIFEALPKEEQWQKLMGTLKHNGHTQEDFDHYMRILFAKNDELKCRLFLEDDFAKPVFILSYLLRQGSSFSNIAALDGILEYVRIRLRDTTDKIPATDASLTYARRAYFAMDEFTTEDFILIMTRLAFHCRRIEPRRLPALAKMMAEFILCYEAESAQETYYAQCRFFNAGLRAVAGRRGSGPQHRTVPYAYMWEAQRILLGMSAGLPEALLVDRNGFRAIRSVLAGMPKNRDEIHSALRHAKTWPPHLLPGDGIDEEMEPNEFWTRVVQAGMMMQEAGFPKHEVDFALDILQGLAPDGTPTIQQRKQISPERNIASWAASIKATRNAHEAWDRFRHPPKDGWKPGPDEYAAMFQRLYAREADLDAVTLPGDTALNYATHEEANLTELERLRLQPPTPADLYEMMRRDRVRTSEECLTILVSNAEKIDEAHRYLFDASGSRKKDYAVLTTPSPTAESLKRIPLPVFSAYIDVCARIPSRRGRRYMLRAIQLAELRLSRRNQNWGSYVWAAILKNLGQHHFGLKFTLEGQISYMLHVVDRIDVTHGMTLPLFDRLTLNLQKILRREVENFAAFMEANNADVKALAVIYGIGAEEASAEPKKMHEACDDPALPAIRAASSRMKGFFYSLVVQERERIRPGAIPEVSRIDGMRARRDPVMAPYAHNLMLALAFAGEFNEMAELMKWLIEEWSPRELQEEMENLEDIPHDLDMLETLCAFRAFAEPMITQRELDQVLSDLDQYDTWHWPDDATVEAYIEGHHSNAHRELIQVLQWIRHKRRTQQADQES
ncbi:hypothetical protein FSARC_9985 [Fusarium sarcochroum]|uniref:Uncharacterized protein n=1 Tax=Fusarium sarcochroum TaxID=1208366 RepID=A0A8H4X5M5_9HYPO|nr:hypothetical protein FSARC_9985 [Fusarium sarcochroum]